MKWLLDKPGRLPLAVVLAGVIAVAAMFAVLSVRLNRVADAIPRATSTPGVGETSFPVETGDGQRLETPDPPAETGPLTQPDQQYATATDRAFPDAGDPTPIAIEAVNEWMNWDFQGLEDNLLPGVLEEAIANPPAKGTRVDGVARLTTPGPTQSVVTVPTTKGPLLVTCVVVEGEWMIESMGWAPGAQP